MGAMAAGPGRPTATADAAWDDDGSGGRGHGDGAGGLGSEGDDACAAAQLAALCGVLQTGKRANVRGAGVAWDVLASKPCAAQLTDVVFKA